MKLQAISLSNASRRQTKHSQWSSVWSVALIISEIISGRERKGSKQVTNQANNKQSLQSNISTVTSVCCSVFIESLSRNIHKIQQPDGVILSASSYLQLVFSWQLYLHT